MEQAVGWTAAKWGLGIVHLVKSSINSPHVFLNRRKYNCWDVIGYEHQKLDGSQTRSRLWQMNRGISFVLHTNQFSKMTYSSRLPSACNFFFFLSAILDIIIIIRKSQQGNQNWWIMFFSYIIFFYEWEKTKMNEKIRNGHYILGFALVDLCRGN